MLEVKNLNVFDGHFHGETLLRNINFSMVTGDRVGVIGPSGAGKSLLASAIIQLLPKTLHRNGEVWFDSVDLFLASRKTLDNVRGKDISIIFQNPEATFNPVFTIGRQIDEAITTHQNLTKSERLHLVHQWMEKAQLVDFDRYYNSYPHQLSGGQLQRLSVIMSLINLPKLVIADEITASLDNENASIIMRMLEEHTQKPDHGLFVISHDLNQILPLCNKLLFLNGGDQQYFGNVHDGVNNAKLKEYLDFRLPDKVIDKHGGLELLKLEKVSKSYFIPRILKSQEVVVLKDISMVIHENEIVGICGPSGSGKSTFAKILVGIETFDDGAITWNGVAYQKKYLPKPQDIQIVFQDSYHSFNPHYTMRSLFKELLFVHKRLYPGRKHDEIISPLMSDFGLNEGLLNKYPAQLSGGQRQRFAILQAILLKPKCIVFDESFSALDMQNISEIMRILFKIKENSKLSIIVISHNVDVLQKMTDRIFEFVGGNLKVLDSSVS